MGRKPPLSLVLTVVRLEQKKKVVDIKIVCDIIILSEKGEPTRKRGSKMEIALIVCGIIYIITVIYNFVASKALNATVQRKLARLHPELVGKKPLRSVSEIIIAIIPAFIPILHNLMALSFMFKQEYLIEQTYDNLVTELTNY